MSLQKKVTNGEVAGNFQIVRQLAAIILLGYAVLIVLFYFLAGEQLHLRESRGDLALPLAENGTMELIAGAVVEQTFTAEIQRLEDQHGNRFAGAG